MSDRASSSASAPIHILIAWCAIFLSSAPVLAQDNPPRPLPDQDRQTLDQYLGAGVVGQPVAQPALTNGVNDLISLHDRVTWRMRVISGKRSGSNEEASAGLLNRPGGDTRFRFDTGDGRNVLFGQMDSKGNLICYASQDNQEGVISRFAPGQPIVLAGMKPGESRRATSDISVADLSQPDVQTHSGKLDMEFEDMGAFTVHVPAGTIQAVLFKTRLTGKVGPAAIDDTIYRFFAKDYALVAEVETEDVSAVLIYHEETRVGKVLVEMTGK